MKTKIIRVSGIRMPLDHKTDDVYAKAMHVTGLASKQILSRQIVRQSIDARKKNDIFYQYSVDLTLERKTGFRSNKNISEVQPVPYAPQCTGTKIMKDPIVVIGAGPAGLFCAYLLALKGYRPILLERGKDVDQRLADVEQFWSTGQLHPNSNVQFGEGGAGTFSDGKLNTGVKDKFGRNHFVLETFVKFGAPEDILYSGKPHIGTDLLRNVVRTMRNEILALGGSVRFSSQVTEITFQDDKIKSVIINDTEELSVSAAVFAIGHSARDTFHMIHDHGITMEAKAFAVGFRVEHPQELINQSQYGKDYDRDHLPPSPYKLTYHAQNGRNVFSFCMCPGGYVVNSSSEENSLCVNGMSYRDRGSQNANSAIIVSVTPEDFPDASDPLSGIAFQRNLEKNAYELQNGRIPQQLLEDFEKKISSTQYGSFDSCVKGQAAFGDLHRLLPDAICCAFSEGMHAFGRKIEGFDRPDTILSGLESRTSSPVRILRNENFESSVSGIYPCGEGAGYAGGITSAAMDGLKAAEAIMRKFAPYTE